MCKWGAVFVARFCSPPELHETGIVQKHWNRTTKHAYKLPLNQKCKGVCYLFTTSLENLPENMVPLTIHWNFCFSVIVHILSLVERLVKYGMIESCYVNLLQAVDDEYAEMNAISGPACTVNVTFEKEEIILEFGKEESGWKITPNAYHNVSLYCATTVLT